MGALVTLTTDFGLADGYVAQMKGVILGLAASAALVDISHDIAPQDVLGGALVLRDCASAFAPGAIHLAVVDPGVGGPRAPLLLCTNRATFVGPDNGLLSLAARREPDSIRGFHLVPARFGVTRPSATFHGRDIFARACGLLASGCLPEDLGDPAPSWVTLAEPRPAWQSGHLVGEVMRIDRFGNLITNLSQELLPRLGGTVEILGRRVQPIVRTYADVAPGELCALVGSSGELELAVREGSAASMIGHATRGTVVTVVP